jgi:hypothetical protein
VTAVNLRRHRPVSCCNLARNYRPVRGRQAFSLRARAVADDGAAARELAGRGDLDRAIQIMYLLADAGDGDADLLTDLITKQGRGEEAERLRRFGLNPDGSIAYT